MSNKSIIKSAFDLLAYNTIQGTSEALIEAANKCGGSILAIDRNHADWLKERGAKRVIIAHAAGYTPWGKAEHVFVDSFTAIRLLGEALDMIKDAQKQPPKAPQ